LELRHVSAIDSSGRTIWIADAHRDGGKRFVVHADERLTAFLELESVIRAARLVSGSMQGRILHTNQESDDT
jgi:hypothetical protein